MKKQNSQRRGGGASRRKAQPPQIRTNVQVVHTYRFRSTSDTAQNIGELDLLGIAGAVCETANTSVSLVANAVKVHKVSIWTPPASQGAAATCSIEWTTADTYARMVEVSDTTMSTATPAHVSSRPPVGSAASFWIGGGGSDVIARLTAPTGSIIDVHATHVLNDTGGAGATVTVAAGTLGVLYYLPLDGPSDVFLPVSLNTTT